nr:helix-turn-helix transcriptional regulator [uncultured Brevundimonas sp.]
MALDLSKRTMLEGFAEKLREARTAKRLSQRRLGASSGVAQSQISKIENAEVDPQLSTFVELARALDLDVQLVPRTAASEVSAVVRASRTRAAERDVRRRLAEIASWLQNAAPSEPNARLQAFVHDLSARAPDLDTEVGQFVLDQVWSRLKASGTAPLEHLPATEIDMLRRSLEALAKTHAPAPGPAYALDDED